MNVSKSLEVEDARIQTLFLKSQQTVIVRIAWTCLVYNLLLCIQLTLYHGLDFFQVVNIALLCLTNGGSIFSIIGAYKRPSWLHLVSPFVMTTQLVFCAQPRLFDLPDSLTWLMQGSMLTVYCLSLLVLITKWVVQAPFAFTICQVGLYLANPIGNAETRSEVLAIVVMNTFLPLVVFFVSYATHRNKIDLYLARMGEAIGQMELSKILKILPQPLFLLDETSEEVLYQSDAMTSCFDQSIGDILPARIFEITKPHGLAENDQGLRGSSTEPLQVVQDRKTFIEEYDNQGITDRPGGQVETDRPLNTDRAGRANVINMNENQQSGSLRQKDSTRTSLESLVSHCQQTQRVKLCDENRFFQVQAKTCRFKQRDAKIVVVQETTQEIEINENQLLTHIYEILHTTITHEIKTPLNAIILTTQQLCYTFVSGKQARLLQINLISAKQMLILVNDLIDLYLIKNGKFKEKLVLANLSTSIVDLFNLVFLQAREKKVTIDTNIQESVKQIVLKFDDQRIRSIILNLVMNAVKFSREGGKIEIVAKFVDEVDGKRQLLVSVADTGIGINDEVKATLFTLFRSITGLNNQLDFGSMGKENNTNGAGLGLTFCKSMIEQLGGSIWFESSKGIGTTFFIKFPVEVASSQDLESQLVEKKSIESVLIEKLQRLQERNNDMKNTIKSPNGGDESSSSVHQISLSNRIPVRTDTQALMPHQSFTPAAKHNGLPLDLQIKMKFKQKAENDSVYMIETGNQEQKAKEPRDRISNSNSFASKHPSSQESSNDSAIQISKMPVAAKPSTFKESNSRRKDQAAWQRYKSQNRQRQSQLVVQVAQTPSGVSSNIRLPYLTDLSGVKIKYQSEAESDRDKKFLSVDQRSDERVAHSDKITEETRKIHVKSQFNKGADDFQNLVDEESNNGAMPAVGQSVQQEGTQSFTQQQLQTIVQQQQFYTANQKISYGEGQMTGELSNELGNELSVDGEDGQNELKDERQVRILLVDDQAFNLICLENLIESSFANSVIETALNGQIALDKVIENDKEGTTFDIIFMDINMPVMDGNESSRLINKEFREGRLSSKPFISAITAYTSEEMKRKSINCGMQKFLTKPAQFDRVFALISDVLNEKENQDRNS